MNITSQGKINSTVSKGKPKNIKETIKKLFYFTKPYKINIIIVIFFAVLSTIFNSFGPYVLGLATNIITSIVTSSISTEQAMRDFTNIIAILSIIYVLFSVFNYLSQYVMSGVSEKTMFDLRSAIDLKLKKLPLNYFDTNSYGDILSRVTNDIDTVSATFQQSIVQILNSIVSVIFIFIMMLIINPLLTLIAVIVVPLCMIVTLVIMKSSQKFFEKQQNSIGEVNGYVEEMYNGHDVILAFGQENNIIEKFKNINHNLYQNGWKAQFISGVIMPISQAITNIGYVGIVVFSGFLCIQGKLSIGMIQSFIQYLRKLSQPITQVAQMSNTFQSTLAAAERIFDFLEAEEEPKEIANPKFPKTVKGSIDFTHVQFGYNKNKILIHDLDLKISPGEKVAIVGPTGAGKTTLVNLILRFYDVTAGHIYIDGVDIMEMQRDKLRSIIGMVLQDTWLFSGSIMENIRYGRLGATDEEVVEAAKSAHADSFIRTLPYGYNMVLHEGATNIAQGERQLITIARAILSKPKILILDEATSSVDTRTEEAIQKAMDTLTEKCTSFVIAHRLSTIKDAEIIIYMENGDIKETGTHESLIQKGGYYAALYNSQFAINNSK